MRCTLFDDYKRAKDHINIDDRLQLVPGRLNADWRPLVLQSTDRSSLIFDRREQGEVNEHNSKYQCLAK